MLSKNQRKQILQLSQKKQRLANGLFVAEGEKVVRELLIPLGFMSRFTLLTLHFTQMLK